MGGAQISTLPLPLENPAPHNTSYEYSILPISQVHLKEVTQTWLGAAHSQVHLRFLLSVYFHFMDNQSYSSANLYSHLKIKFFLALQIRT